jgi:ribonuclease T2
MKDVSLMLLLRSAILGTVALVMALALSEPASAQRYDRYDSDRDTRAGSKAGSFDYYALVLSWSPTHCATLVRDDYEPQCHRRDGRRYNFVLHGLWPQYERGFPNDCYSGRRPFIADRVIEDVIDVMPSKPLIIHEYGKHGTCSGLEAARYFELGERLYRTVKIPQRYVNPFEDQTVAPEALIDEFLAENRQLKRDMIAVVCDGSRNRLKEVRICMSRDGTPRTCGKNENQRKLCSAATVYVPPVRSSASARTEVPGRGQQDRGAQPERNHDDRRDGGWRGDSPLPGPR